MIRKALQQNYEIYYFIQLFANTTLCSACLIFILSETTLNIYTQPVLRGKDMNKRYIYGCIQILNMVTMKQQFHYAPVSDAIKQLHKQGYTLDFDLKGDKLVTNDNEYPADEFEIADLYRYEGPSDPADEATVYALVSKSGLKGILVSGYGVSSDSISADTLKQLHYKYQQGKS